MRIDLQVECSTCYRSEILQDEGGWEGAKIIHGGVLDCVTLRLRI